MKTPQHRVGVHWIPVHGRPEDEAYMSLLKPGAIKIINPDPAQIRRCLTYLDSNGVLILRDHPLSEQKADMTRDPIGTGVRHATEWAAKFKPGGRFEGLQSEKIVICGINEPFVRTFEEEQIVVEYTRSLLQTSRNFGLRVLAFNLSVGWPRNLGRDLPPQWEFLKPLEEEILLGNHFGGFHEYYYSDPDESWFDGGSLGKWGWLTYRVNSCPLNIPIIIGEWGMEKMVDVERWKNEGRPPKGWVGNITSSQYAEHLWRYAEKVNPNVFSILPFTTDWGSHDWETQDTKVAHSEILRLKKPAIWSNPYPSTGGEVPPLPAGDFKLCWPLGTITQYFGGKHSGLDIAMPLGTPIYAVYDGEVAWVDNDSTGYGNYIRISHPSLGFHSFYAHLTSAEVAQGQKVRTGQKIGVSGSTGNSSDPHLHLEVRLVTSEGRYRVRVSNFLRGQVDPVAVKYSWGQNFGYEEK